MKKLKKWVRRIAIFTAGFWAVTAVLSAYSVYLSRSTPDWYITQRPNNAAESDLANQSLQTATDLFSYASDVGAAQRRAFLDGTTGTPIAPRTFTLSETQLNAFLSRWQDNLGGSLGGNLGQYLTEPRVALRKGSFILAGLVHNVGVISNSVVSIELRPEIDDQGNLWPKLAHIYNGRLPVPLVLLEKPRKNLQTALEDALPTWQLAAGIGSDGLGNPSAAKAVAAELFLASIADKSANAYILLPCAVGNMQKTVPIRVTQLTIADQRLTVSLSPLTDRELRNLLLRISS